jgi:hypothetical protein
MSEIFPLEVKAKAIALANTFNFTLNCIVTFLFALEIEALGQSLTFLIFTVILVFSLLFIYVYIPETKGIKFEQIENYFLNLSFRQSMAPAPPTPPSAGGSDSSQGIAATDVKPADSSTQAGGIGYQSHTVAQIENYSSSLLDDSESDHAAEINPLLSRSHADNAVDSAAHLTHYSSSNPGRGQPRPTSSASVFSSIFTSSNLNASRDGNEEMIPTLSDSDEDETGFVESDMEYASSSGNNAATNHRPFPSPNTGMSNRGRK